MHSCMHTHGNASLSQLFIQNRMPQIRICDQKCQISMQSRATVLNFIFLTDENRGILILYRQMKFDNFAMCWYFLRAPETRTSNHNYTVRLDKALLVVFDFFVVVMWLSYVELIATNTSNFTYNSYYDTVRAEEYKLAELFELYESSLLWTSIAQTFLCCCYFRPIRVYSYSSFISKLYTGFSEYRN